ncbi:hypothetical protein BDQ12DRAFT_681737 [Crucibulum laeve]|uniref:VLRF1 domain-containing protein n=1 Tax=Crucibulum laeve TaxID=68775 RepID=A0A5C3M2D3_9AGAR|nr:hypothetical protein BDQ12DRAFT_681737 [Crucibulum laeve]
MQASQYHVFSLSPELLDTLTPRNLVNKAPTRSPSPEPVVPSTSGPRACNICLGVTFQDVDEQRTHFRSDWHRYNVKVRLNGGTPVSEANFAQLVDALEDSISGSASSSDEDESSESDAVKILMKKTKRLTTRSTSPESTRQAPQTALTWFHSPPSTQIGVYRALFPLGTEADSYLQELKNLQQSTPEGRTWALFMTAGGHFAGALVRVSRAEDDEEPEEEGVRKKKKQKKPKPEIEVLKHKTFHRYTTRRKQGGSQSVNDNAKGPAKSAGAQLRRYGEQALRDDIRSLLDEWAEDIHDCERIWIRASVSNRKIFLDYDESPIAKGDERLRTFPFPTRRPTQSELMRCLMELLRPKVSHLTEDALRAQDEAYLASLPKPKPILAVAATLEPEKPKQPKLTKEEEILREKWVRLLEMVNKGRLEPLRTFWEREGGTIGGVDVAIPEWAGERRVSLLQVAAGVGHEEVTRWLLEDLHADPTITVPVGRPGEVEDEDAGNASDASDSPRALPKGSRRTAYDLARSKPIRDVFRRCAASHPDWWDWFGAARVPSALSKEMEDERDEKKKVRRKGLKDRIKEREAREREKEKEKPVVVPEPPKPAPAKEQSSSGPRKLGGATGAVEGVAGLTPEMRAKVERERRARAAEARMKALDAK